MFHSRKRSMLCRGAVALLTMATLASVASNAQQCYVGSALPSVDPRCARVPISLPCLTDIPTDIGWADPGGSCGFRVRFRLFACPCGDPIALAACP